MNLLDYRPRRQQSDAHWRVYQSRNSQVYVSFGGSIYLFHVAVGRVSFQVDAKDYGLA